MWELFFPIFWAGLAIFIKPEPYSLACASMAAAGKWREMLVFVLTGTIASSIMYFLVLSSLSLLPDNFGIVFLMLKGVAAMMFVILGLTSLQESVEHLQKKSEEQIDTIKSNTLAQAFFSAVFLSFSNPYDLTFAVAAVPTLTETLSFSLIDIVIIRLAIAAADVVVIAVYCLPFIFLRKFISNNLLFRLKLVSGFAMIGIAIFITINMILQWDLEATALL